MSQLTSPSKAAIIRTLHTYLPRSYMSPSHATTFKLTEYICKGVTYRPCQQAPARYTWLGSLLLEWRHGDG